MKNLSISQDTCNYKGIFINYNFANTSIPLQGYKIHVSATFFNYLEVKKIVKAYCFKKRINFKYIVKRKDFLISVSKLSPVTFSGKYFTLYPENNSHAKKILRELYPNLKHLKGPKITTDRQYKNSILQYRFGDFVDEGEILKQGGRSALKLFSDKREINYFKPQEAKELFAKDATRTINIDKVREYTPIYSVFVSNFGGVYIFERNKKLFIAKEARPYLGTSEIDEPISRRKYENKLHNRLPNNFPTPKFIESFFFRKHHYSIYEFVEGDNLRDWKPNLLLNFIWNQSKERKTKIESILKVLINLFISILTKCQKIKLIINDIKADNFIFNPETQQLTLVDLDYSFFVGDKPLYIRNSLGRKDKVFNHENEVRKTGLLLVDLISNSSLLANKAVSMQKIIDYFKLFCSYYKIDKEIYQNILYLLKFSKNDSLKKIKTKNKPDYLPTFKNSIFVNINKLETLDFFDFIFEEYNDFQKDNLDPEESVNLLWKKIYLNIKANNQEQAQKAINELVKKRVKRILNNKVVFDNKGNFLLYLNNGNARLVLLLLMFEKKFSSFRYRSLLEDLIEAIKVPFLLNATFLGGLPGIIYCHFEIYKYTKNKEYLNIAIKQFQVLKIMRNKGKFFDVLGNKISNEENDKIIKIFEIFENSK